MNNMNIDERDRRDMCGRVKMHTFLEQYHQDYTDSEDEFCPYDLRFISNDNRRIAVEIKDRAEKYKYYDSLIIEKTKYDRLTKELVNFDDIFYITFIGNEMFVYSIEKVREILERDGLSHKRMKKITCSDDETTNIHSIIYLPKTDALKFVYTINKETMRPRWIQEKLQKTYIEAVG